MKHTNTSKLYTAFLDTGMSFVALLLRSGTQANCQAYPLQAPEEPARQADHTHTTHPPLLALFVQHLFAYNRYRRSVYVRLHTTACLHTINRSRHSAIIVA